MSKTLTVTVPLIVWQGDRGTYHLVEIKGEAAGTIATHARLHRLEFGRRRGFGSVKVLAQIGTTQWKSSVFPAKSGGWILLVSKKVMRAEGIGAGDELSVVLELL
ncbi:DUF1905 domain-containing protein [Qipengyuania sp. CAU 1752]